MLDIFTRHGVCAHCEQPIHSVGRSAIHTDTDMFTCEGGHAEFAVGESAEQIRDEAYEVGYQQGVDDTESKADQAFRDGRRELARELYKWIKSQDRDAAFSDDFVDQLLDRLAEE